MWVWIGGVLLLVIGYKVLWWSIIRQSGNESQRARRRDDRPWNAEELRQDCGRGVTGNIYQVFEEAYRSQKDGDHEYALHLYTEILRHLKGTPSHGRLLQAATFQHNWRLLFRQLNRPLQDPRSI